MSHAIDELDIISPGRRAPSVIDSMLIENRKPADKRRTLTNRERLLAIEHEARLIAVAGENIATGQELTQADLRRVWLAVERINWIVSN